MADEIELTPDPMLGVGTWSNWTRVLRGTEQVTIDFAVRDPLEPSYGTLVVRVNLSLGAAYDLRDTLTQVMRSYTDPDHPQRG